MLWIVGQSRSSASSSQASQMTRLARAPVMFSAEEIKALEEVTDQPPKDFAISRLPHTKECESMPERSSFDSQRMM